ncbi:MarR family transcriptional regulator [Hyphomonas sp. FCG-A18]|uniref:MarR family winged helix-turn-helix transcriptional regulator n=1 Tax=Hyphomonas sp. FCG-A18 TaxID=3080019 RepID=UPI002B288626|nr:MarR family transcriptional regulator [Hyphomonas sp. FCG-A18]
MSDANSIKAPVVTLDNQLCFALYAASNTVGHHYQTLLKSYGLTYSQYLVLMALAEEDGISISALAKRLELSKATMTPLLRRLEERGVLLRQVRKGNERQKLISLTNAGRQLWEKSRDVSAEVFTLTKLSKVEANEVIRICKKIVHTQGTVSASG